MEDRAFVLEWQLNHIRASIDISGNYIQDAFSGCRERNSDVIKLQSKLTSCMFSLNSAGFSCPESFLTCPITLCVPEVGVFMKNSRDSNICSLYDKESLSYLIKTSAPHPLSREVITESMIVGGFAPIFPDTCYHLTHYWLAAVDIPVASDNPVHYADAIRYNARTPLQGSLLPLTRLVWA